MKARYITMFGARVKVGSPIYKFLVANKAALRGLTRKKHKPTPAEVVMFDDVNLDLVPASAPAVAGYVGGRYRTYPKVLEKFAKAKHLSIAIAATEDARCLDVEKYDATIPQAAPWVKRQHARGVKKPVVYTSVSQAQQLVNALKAAGLKQGRDYLLWTAHYSFHPHRCDHRCGFDFAGLADATQWTDQALGRSLDESLCSPTFFD